MKVKPLNRERNNNKSSRHNNVQLAIIMLLTSLLFLMGSRVNHQTSAQLLSEFFFLSGWRVSIQLDEFVTQLRQSNVSIFCLSIFWTPQRTHSSAKSPAPSVPTGLTDSIVNQSETRWPPACLFEWQPFGEIANGITFPGDVLSLCRCAARRLTHAHYLCCFEIRQTLKRFEIRRYCKTCQQLTL